MGFTPAQIDGMSLWEFLAVRDGYVAANSPTEGVRPPTAEEHDAMLERYG